MQQDLYPIDWKTRAAACLARAGYRCEQCGIPHGVLRVGKRSKSPYVVYLHAAHAFLHAWRETYGEREVLVAEVVRALKAASLENTGVGADLYHALPDDLSDIHKGDFRRRLGKALSLRVGSQFDESGLHLVKAARDPRSGSTYWKVADLQISQI